ARRGRREVSMPASDRLSSYFARTVLVLGATLLGTIALRAIVDPVGTAAHNQIFLRSDFAVTVQQVGFGAFPLAAALFALGSAFSRKSLAGGLTLVAALVLTAVLVRLYGILQHGGLALNLRPLAGEFTLGILSLVALWLERRRKTV